jgi:hypothetical protein
MSSEGGSRSSNYSHVFSSRCAVSEQRRVLPARDVVKADTRFVALPAPRRYFPDHGLASVYLKNRSGVAGVMPRPKQCTIL